MARQIPNLNDLRRAAGANGRGEPTIDMAMARRIGQVAIAPQQALQLTKA